VGIHYRDGVVPLFSSRANMAAERLILHEIIPDLTEIRREFTLGDSRFDFLCLDSALRRHLVEVKACSLVEYGTAMFPDAPSLRALKHLEELSGLAEQGSLAPQGYICHVLFVIVHGTPERFIPNLHTDPAFAAALSRYGTAVDPPTGSKVSGSGKVLIHAALLHCDAEGRARLEKSRVPVDLSYGALAESNRGNYLIILHLPKPEKIAVGALGPLDFEEGWYVYAGSAQKALSSRVNRHLRRFRKQLHWHLDYLTPFAQTLKALPIMSYQNLECSLARALADLGGRPVPRFGSSDCRCPSHLYHFNSPPMNSRAFVDMLLRFRHPLVGFIER
jgi:sugar fermentation stimulation protein A